MSLAELLQYFLGVVLQSGLAGPIKLYRLLYRSYEKFRRSYIDVQPKYLWVFKKRRGRHAGRQA